MGAESPGSNDQPCDWPHNEALSTTALQYYGPRSLSFETSDEETFPFDHSIQDQIDPALKLQSPLRNASNSEAGATSQALTTSMSIEGGPPPSGANAFGILKDLPRLEKLNEEAILMVRNSVATPH